MERKFQGPWVLAMTLLALSLQLVVPAILIMSVFIAFLALHRLSVQSEAQRSQFSRFFFASLSAYVFIVIGVFLFDQFLTWRMYSFDIDGNGIFSDSEGTNALFVYQDAVSDDLGRNLVPITSILIAPVAATIALFLEKALRKLKLR